MAFCTNCGTQLDDAAKFCTICGAKVPEAVTPHSAASYQAQAAAPAPTPAPVQNVSTPPSIQPVATKSGGNALKIILIVLVVIVVLGVVGTVAGILAVRHVVSRVHVNQSGDKSTVELPGMSVRSNDDATKVAQDLGVDVYPGAKSLEGASAVTVGNLTVGTAQFETGDPIDRVEQFYKSRFPKSNINTSDENSRVMLMATNKGLVNIVLERAGDTTKITISRTAGHRGSGSDDESQ